MTRQFILAALALLAATAAQAHTGDALGGGFLTGFTHPLLGWDHIVAMVAVGLWGAILGPPAVWILPITFPLVMAFGGALGVAGVTVPMVETGIAASGLVLGLMVAFAVRPALWIAALLVGLFAIFHGHAHGTELPTAANPYAYAAGFVVGTGLLHLAGIAFGTLMSTPAGSWAVRAAGLVIAAAGGAFLTGVA
jgi:urease accessory protein